MTEIMWNITGMWEINEKNMTWTRNLLPIIQQEYDKNMTKIRYEYDSNDRIMTRITISLKYYRNITTWQEYEKFLLPFEYAGPIPKNTRKTT